MSSIMFFCQKAVVLTVETGEMINSCLSHAINSDISSCPISSNVCVPLISSDISSRPINTDIFTRPINYNVCVQMICSDISSHPIISYILPSDQFWCIRPNDFCQLYFWGILSIFVFNCVANHSTACLNKIVSWYL
jgi:hypothetical protein